MFMNARFVPGNCDVRVTNKFVTRGELNRNALGENTVKHNESNK